MDLGFGDKNQAVGGATAAMLGKLVDLQESMLDDEIKKLDDLDAIRARRLKEMKERQLEVLTWSDGSLKLLGDTRGFFEAAKAKRFCCHFERPTSHHCVSLNGLLARIAATHKETWFARLDAEKVPYLCEKLLSDPEGKVVIPTLLLCKDGKVVYHVRGLNDVGGDNMTAASLTAVLHSHGLLENVEVPPSYDEYRKNAIRSGLYDDDIDDDDYTGEIA